jgi:hypothetical protein
MLIKKDFILPPSFRPGCPKVVELFKWCDSIKERVQEIVLIQKKKPYEKVMNFLNNIFNMRTLITLLRKTNKDICRNICWFIM